MIDTSFKVYVYLFRTYAAWEENIPVCPNAEHEQRRLLQEYCCKFEIYKIPDPLTIPKQNWIPEVEGITKWPSVYYNDIAKYLNHLAPEFMSKLDKEVRQSISLF